MEYWLVKGEIRHNRYMIDEPEYIQDQKFVKASNAKEARAKFEKYWEEKNDSYGDYYYVIDAEVIETIE